MAGSLYSEEIYDKIHLNKLRWAGHLIRIDAGDAEKVYRDNIYV